LECIEDLDASPLLPAAWEDVLSKSSHDHVCFTYEWTRAWWKAFGKGKRLLILAAVDDRDHIRALAPLMLQKTSLFGLPVRKISFIYNDNASRADLIDGGYNREIVEGMIAYLTRNTGLWDVVELQNIWECSMTYHNLRQVLKQAGIRFALKTGLRSPFVTVNTDWGHYFSSRSKNFHKSFRNLQNRYKSKTGWSIDHPKNLDGIYAISRRSWKARCKRDICADDSNRDFFNILTDIANEKGWLHLWLLTVEGKGIAYEYALEYKRTMYALKADFDESARHLSPGVMLHTQLMKYCFERGFKEIDLCGHDEDYKIRWSDGIRNHAHVTMYRAGFYGMLLYVLDHKVCYGVKNVLKKIKLLNMIKRNMQRR